MHEVFGERILVHGPYLKDLTDLLYFDKIVYPTTTAVRQLLNFLPEPVRLLQLDEPLPERVRSKLASENFIVPAGVFVLSPSDDEGFEILAEVALAVLDEPVTADKEAAWLQDIDAKTKIFADFAVKQGVRVKFALLSYWCTKP